jgi:hypothetical protein
VSDAVRAVMRHIIVLGLGIDDMEINATDAMAYGAAIDSLARRLGIALTCAAGLPVARTRPGRAVDAYLRWVRASCGQSGAHNARGKPTVGVIISSVNDNARVVLVRLAEDHYPGRNE